MIEKNKGIMECWNSGMLEDWNDGRLEEWKNGMMEEWNDGKNQRNDGLPELTLMSDGEDWEVDFKHIYNC